MEEQKLSIAVINKIVIVDIKPGFHYLGGGPFTTRLSYIRFMR